MTVILITGASKGIGLETACHLAKSGYRVFAGCRQFTKELSGLEKSIPKLSFVFLDVTDQDSVNRAVTYVVNEAKRIDVLINNAGLGIYGPTELHTIDEIKLIFEANLYGVIRMNQAVIPIMRAQNCGKIINISSVSGLFPSINLPVYSASKAALEYISAVDKAELSKWNITVCNVHPGPVVTEFADSTPMAKRAVTGDPYNDLEKRRAAWNSLMATGQRAMEIAEQIRAIIVEGSPFWNPTSEEVMKKIKAHYVDPTGRIRIPAKL